MSPTITPFPLPTLPPLHCTVGSTVRYSTTLTLHINTKSDPAVTIEELAEIVTSGSGRSEGVHVQYVMISLLLVHVCIPWTLRLCVPVAVRYTCNELTVTLAVIWPLSEMVIGE